MYRLKLWVDVKFFTFRISGFFRLWEKIINYNWHHLKYNLTCTLPLPWRRRGRMLIWTAQFQSSALLRIGAFLDDGVQLQGCESSRSPVASQGYSARRTVHASCGNISTTEKLIIKVILIISSLPPWEKTRRASLFESAKRI